MGPFLWGFTFVCLTAFSMSPPQAFSDLFSVSVVIDKLQPCLSLQPQLLLSSKFVCSPAGHFFFIPWRGIEGQ